MRDTWHNNLISKELSLYYPHDFSICDLNGVVRWSFFRNGEQKHRLIIYESKNQYEKISNTQLESLRILNEHIDWTDFDNYSGCYIIKIIKEKKDKRPVEMEWYNLYDKMIRKTTMDELYKIFSGKV